jgi:dTDP-4-amino-4,6-dideoxygalactose transaminase
VVAPGINAKMNEFQAGMGLLQLQYMDEILAKRTAIANRYMELLSGMAGISFLTPGPQVDYNHAYFPIFVDAAAFGRTRDDLYAHLKSYNYLCRRYFYPLISSFNMYKSLPGAEPGNLPVATRVAEDVLCLPIFPDLDMAHVNNVVEIIATYKK